MAAALTDLGLGDEIVGTFGPLKNAAGEPDSQVAGLDVDDVTDVTAAGEYGSIDLEKAATLKPDLVVTSAYLDDDLWYINDATAKDLKKLAPIAVVSFDGKTLPELLERHRACRQGARRRPRRRRRHRGARRVRRCCEARQGRQRQAR